MVTIAASTAAVAIALLTILVYYKERARIIITSHKARWELRKIAAQKACGGEDGGQQLRVSGIFIHPGKYLARRDKG